MKIKIFLFCSFLLSFAEGQNALYRTTREILSDTTNPEEIAVAFSFIGRYDQAAHFGKRLPEAEPENVNLQKIKLKDLKNMILKKTKDAQVLFLGENSFNPVHRCFTETLLKDFYRQGYRFFSADAVDSEDSLLNTRKFPLRETGFLINEPQYGELIRSALKNNFKVLSSETFADDLRDTISTLDTIHLNIGRNNREMLQALKLWSLIKDGKTKVIVYSNALLLQQRSKAPSMIKYLKSFSNKPPLIIQMSSFPDKENSEILSGSWLQNNDETRLNLIIPCRRELLEKISSRIPYKTNESEGTLCEALYSQEENGVPLDILETDKNTDFLYLPKGKWQLRTTSSNGSVRKSIEVR